MNTADMFDDSWPHTHGTVDGYDNGCKASICPAGTEYGLSCKIAKSLSRNDFKYQRLVKAGATVPEIAAEFELVGTANAPAAAPKPAKKGRPTPATARGGRSLAKAAADTGAIAEQLITAAAITPLEQAQQIRDIVGPLRREDGTLNTTAIAEEATLRQRAGLPAWIAELDAPNDDAEQPAPESAGEPVAAAPTPREIREWARGRGYEVGVKGKIPQHIVDHYWEATGRLDELATAQTAPRTDLPAHIAEHTEQLEDKLTELLLPAPGIEAARAYADAEYPELPLAPENEILADVAEQAFIAGAGVPDTCPEWSTIAMHQDLEAARNLAVRLEQELARVEQQHDALAQVYAATMNDHADASSEDLRVIEDLAVRLDQAEAERDSANHALELAIRKWGEERAANEASYAVILEQASTINRLVGSTTPQSQADDELLENEIRTINEIQDPARKSRERQNLLLRLAVGSRKAHTR